MDAALAGRLRMAFHTRLPQLNSSYKIFRCYALPAQAPWRGLEPWRQSEVNEQRIWGAKGPEEAPKPLLPSLPAEPSPPAASLAEAGRQVLLTPDPVAKAALTHAAWRAYRSGRLQIGEAAAPPVPSRPAKPELVSARAVPTIKQTDLPLNVYTLHTLAHVELNAIDLAWDTVVRFSQLKLPEKFYADFARVADDEGRHLSWCLQRLGELGYEYGCLPSHALLWDGCAASAGDVAARLAVVPMSQEARGLDAGVRLAERLVGKGDNRSAAIVARIADEERAHVGVGVEWFTAICRSQGVDPSVQFAEALARLCPDLLKGSSTFNHEARSEVGLLREFYDEALWSERQREAAAAAQRAADESGSAFFYFSSGGGETGLRSAVTKEGDDRRMEELQRRLEAMLAMELTASGE